MKEQKKRKENHIDVLRKQMKNSKALIQKIDLQRQLSWKEATQKKQYQRGLTSIQRKIEIKQQIVPSKILKSIEVNSSRGSKGWSYSSTSQKLGTKILPSSAYYPPSCSGYDMAYCKYTDTIYIYGGIACSSSLQDGIKQYFYKLSEGRWSEVKPESTYHPSPRYGHTFTSYIRDVILFGGVSQYKQKLKDRCFYTDCSAYSTLKNNWRMVQTCGQSNKTRKNHAATVYNKFYIISGGVNQSQQTIGQISWINLECKKSRWKTIQVEGRFNHKMIVVEPQNGKDFLCIYGGRNERSQIVSSMFYVPLNLYDSQLIMKEVISIPHCIYPRQMPMMAPFMQGFLILGGVNEHNDVEEDCWYYNSDKQVIEEIKLTVSFSDLRGAKISPYNEKLYILTANSSKFKALLVESEKNT